MEFFCFGFYVVDFFQVIELFFIRNLGKLNLCVTPVYVVEKCVVDDNPNESGIPFGEFFKVLFPGITIEVGKDVLEKLCPFCVPPVLASVPVCYLGFFCGIPYGVGIRDKLEVLVEQAFPESLVE